MNLWNFSRKRILNIKLNQSLNRFNAGKVFTLLESVKGNRNYEFVSLSIEMVSGSHNYAKLILDHLDSWSKSTL